MAQAIFFATLVILHNLFPKVAKNAAQAMATLNHSTWVGICFEAAS